MSEKSDAIVSVAKGTTAVGLATGAQVVEGARQAADVVNNLFVLSPANIASWLAAIFVFCQLWEWWWTRMWRPLFEKMGWLQPKPKRRKTPPDSERMGL